MKQNLFLLGGFFFFLACSNEPKKVQSDAPADLIEIAYQFDTVLLEKEWGNCSESDEGCITISFSYPQIINPDSIGILINQRIVRMLKVHVQDSVGSAEEYSDYLIEEFKKTQSENSTAAGWQIENEIAVEYMANRIVSIRQFGLENNGAAHPDFSLHLRSFSALNGQRILLDDVFKDNYRDSLMKLAVFYLGTAMNASMEIEFVEGSTKGASSGFELSENFNLDENGINFLHIDPLNQSDGSGFVEFTIPYSELIDANLINENGVLSFLLGSVNP
ncbi:MAG: DUF4163 domain-containing protein [Bacteroidetes bacterium]|nr:DUF4163 domain-containing protein [Bacteroidota bacterium]